MAGVEAIRSEAKESKPVSNPAIDILVQELENLDQVAFPALHALAECELFRLRGGIADSIDIIENKRVKIRAKINIPAEQFPYINFVGKLLGPGGQTLRTIQDETKTKMAILGSGSLRDEGKEKELLTGGDPKFQHLKQRLHLQIDSLATPVESYYRLSHALSEVRKVMLPEINEVPPPPWGQGMPPANMPRGGGPPRGRARGRGYGPGPAPGFPPSVSGTFPPPPNGQAAPAHRGRGVPRGRGRGWIPRGGANPVQPNGSIPVSSGDYTNGDMYGYAPPENYEAEYNGGYDDFGTAYGQAESWGKMATPDTRGRGRGRGRPHPYGRPGGKDESA